MKNMKMYNKLVRDRIPEHIEQAGKKFLVHAAEKESLKAYALRKLQEEVAEFIENPSAEEAADVMEIFHYVCDQHDLRDATIMAQTVSKRITHGAFDRGLVLCWVEDK